MRLRTLPVSVAGVLTAVGYSLGDGTFKALPAMLCLIFAILCQIASNFANEYYDYRAGRDHVGRQGPRRGVTEGDITPQAMRNATFGVLIVAAMVGLSLTYWGGLWLIIAGALIGIGALAYSAGPWALSTHCLGEVAVFLFFGIVPVNLTYYVQALAWSTDVFLGSCAIGLMGANVLLVNNIRDIDDDISVNKHTLATAWGKTACVGLYILFSVAAAGLMYSRWCSLGAYWLSVPVLYIIISVSLARKIYSLEGSALNRFLGITATLMLLYSLAFLIANL